MAAAVERYSVTATSPALVSTSPLAPPAEGDFNAQPLVLAFSPSGTQPLYLLHDGRQLWLGTIGRGAFESPQELLSNVATSGVSW